MFYIGGELAQSRLGLPKAMSSVFQGILLFTLLACDTFVNHKLRLIRSAPQRGVTRALEAKGAAQ
jgi:simple sugar transport system permease protein